MRKSSTTRAHSKQWLRGVADDVVRGYVDEAITCLRAGALRAAVVFLWTGAVRTLHEAALKKGTAQLNAALQKHDPKARKVAKVEDFAYVRDKIFLLACGELGVLDKGERTTLEDALDLRNRCGHPTKYRPGVLEGEQLHRGRRRDRLDLVRVGRLCSRSFRFNPAETLSSMGQLDLAVFPRPEVAVTVPSVVQLGLGLPGGGDPMTA